MIGRPWCDLGRQILRLSSIDPHWTIPRICGLVGRDRHDVLDFITFIINCGAPVILCGDQLEFVRAIESYDKDCLYEHLSLTERTLKIFWCLDSTNQYCLDQPRSSQLEFCLSESQSAGRGRYSKQWTSLFSAGVFLSFRSVFSQVDRLHCFSQLLSLVLVDAMKRRYPLLDFAIKWPNDILLFGKKVMGILVETCVEPDQTILVAGIGCNLNSNQLNQSQPICGLDEFVADVNKTEFVALLMSCCRRAVDMFKHRSFAFFADDYDACHAFHGASVVYEENDSIFRGTVLGVHVDGALVVLDQLGDAHYLYSDRISRLRLDEFSVTS